MFMTKPNTKYLYQKHNSIKRGIPFLLTFEEWWDIWQQSGYWEQRGCRKGQYVMSRYNDVGPYAVGNVFIQQCGSNVSQAQMGKISHRKNKTIGNQSEEHRAKRSRSLKGKPWSEARRMSHFNGPRPT